MMKQTNVLTHLAAGAIATIFCALLYVSVQQSYRSGANDPQFQIAGDISNKLKRGASIVNWFASDTCEIESSLCVFQTLYDENKKPVLSTGLLSKRLPALPAGVFDVARKQGENVFTWQPEAGVRMAIVLRSVQSPHYSFVAVGRSLYEVEKREKNLMWTVFVGWLLCMGLIILHRVIGYLRSGKISKA